MPPLPSDLRKKLEHAIAAAREVAEAGAKAALESLAVHEPKFYPHMTKPQQALRTGLRARARQLGDQQGAGDRLTLAHLIQECAYEHWHRMLFARFLAENNLLIHAAGQVPITLADAEELAKTTHTDLWTYASRCAQQMLPRIFRPDDPVLKVALAGEYRVKLEGLLNGLAAETFTADDSLGWVYQFWQSQRKEQVNASGDKITGDTLPAVTQLFTEHYMVLFLLHNTIGAWHAGKLLAASPALAKSAASEEALKHGMALKTHRGYSFDYLRFVRDAAPDSSAESAPWRPAAGVFPGWPRTAAEIKVLDPCCGSGHFLVAAFELLVPLRMAEEKLDINAAVDAVLTNNLFGLEIDARCTQIAAFNLALAAWKITGYRQLPTLHIACSGLGPQASEEDWLKLVDDAQSRRGTSPVARDEIRRGLEYLHGLFLKAHTLGSLINPAKRPDNAVFTADYEMLLPVLGDAFAAETTDAEEHERAVAAQGMVRAVEILADQYTLVVTNVPYLGRGKQDDILKDHLDMHFAMGKADLATAFVLRCLDFCAGGGTAALVTPQNWLFLTTYTKLRQNLLRESQWNLVARLGAKGFQTPMWDFNIQLGILSGVAPAPENGMSGIDVSTAKRPEKKAAMLRGETPAPIVLVPQAEQLENPDAAVSFHQPSGLPLLSEYADSFQGSGVADISRFRLMFWELSRVHEGWVLHASSPVGTPSFSGMHYALLFCNGEGELVAHPLVSIRGREAWGKSGVACAWLGRLPVGRYLGTLFDNSAAAIMPRAKNHLPAIWCFCSSAAFAQEVRKINQKVQVANATLVKVPFDLAHWQAVAAEKYPNGLPEPESDDPTQWLFHGRPEASTLPLQVAVARLLGYRWPAELDETMRLSQRARDLVKRCDDLLKFAENSGVVCIPAVRGEEPAADRLHTLLDAAGIGPAKIRELAGGLELDEWLRTIFFKEHCEQFHHRPFLWHIWDGKRDGFHALVNYHKLAGPDGRQLLETLTYSYLGEWISRQKAAMQEGGQAAQGADDREAAALELKKRLEAILTGEPPFDLFIRWKPLHEQPLGWAPDINDGVRLNIRPFLADDLPTGRTGAGVLRWKPNIKWEKDRGCEPERPRADYPWFWGWDGQTVNFTGGAEFKGERFNNCHFTIAAKHAARAAHIAPGLPGAGPRRVPPP